MKSVPRVCRLLIITAFSGQCKPNGTMNRYRPAISAPTAPGATSLTFFRKSEIPIATPIPMGPTTKAVTGTRIITDSMGTKTICSIFGIIFFNRRSRGAKRATANRGGNT